MGEGGNIFEMLLTMLETITGPGGSEKHELQSEYHHQLFYGSE